MKRALVTAGAIIVFASTVFAGGPPAPNAFWVDGQLYRTVGTPNSLPAEGPKDGIYTFTGLSGQTNVAEAKPGDLDYNGGRWQVTVLRFTPLGVSVHDPDGDGTVNFQLTSWEMVEEHIGLGHLEFVGLGPSFVCPVIP
jgi:hypothetical protein